MLALSRKKDEAIVINNDIEVTIIEVKGDQVKLGITAPKSVPVSSDSGGKPCSGKRNHTGDGSFEKIRTVVQDKLIRGKVLIFCHFSPITVLGREFIFCIPGDSGMIFMTGIIN